MILRAIIESQEDINHYRIRIPILNKSKDAAASTSFDQLYIATVCTLPGITVNYAKDDVVFVGFEKNQEQLPVILGQLQRNNGSDSLIDVSADSITCSSDMNISGNLSFTNQAKKDFYNQVETIIENQK